MCKICSKLTTRTPQQLGPKKIILLFPEMRVTRNIFPGGRKFNFFHRFSGDVLFSSLISFAFFILFGFLLLFVCCSLNLKMYIMIHMRLCERVSDKKIFTRPISGNKTTFFGLTFFGLQICRLISINIERQ